MIVYWAKLDSNYTITEILVFDGKISDQTIQKYLNSNFEGHWIKASYKLDETSPDIPIKGNLPGIGHKYDASSNFIMPTKPHSSWIIDTKTAQWKPPIEKPDGGFWKWKEELGDWIEEETENLPHDVTTIYFTDLISCGFPRSGNTYLCSALGDLFGNNRPVKVNHNVSIFDTKNTVIVPIRDPLNSLVSLHFMNFEPAKNNIKYFIRFYNALLKNKDKLIVLNFNNFTTDLFYIKHKIQQFYGLKADNKVTLESIKVNMQKDSRGVNLPQRDPHRLSKEDEVKSALVSDASFLECVNLYNQINQLS